MSSVPGSGPYRAAERVALRRALPYAAGSVLLIGALIAYCELGSLVRGLPPAGLRSSAPWALQTALPWIVIGAIFGPLRSRLPSNGGDVIRSGLWIAAVVLGIAAFALLGETLVRALTGAADIFALLCERAPVSIAVSSLLVAIYVGSRSRQWERESTPSGTPT